MEWLKVKGSMLLNKDGDRAHWHSISNPEIYP